MQRFTSRHTFMVLAFLVGTGLSRFSSADTITVTSSEVPTTLFSPSSDSISFNAGSGTYDVSSGSFVLQTGDFIVGNSAIPDQMIPFSFQDTVTLDGISQTLTVYGQDNVTDAADVLTIFNSTPVIFGNEVFTIQSLTLTAADMGDYPIALEAYATPAPTPEPGSIILLGTGFLGGAIVVLKKAH